MVSGIVIVGAGMAGCRAAIMLRERGFGGPVALIGREALMPYDRPPLSKSAITDEVAPQPAWLMDEALAASLKVDVRRNVSAQSIDRAAKTVRLSDGSELQYTKLLLATGAKPRKLSVPGGEWALLLRTFEDALLLRRRFQPGRRIVIIGGGFIGLELASSAIRRGCKVALIEAQSRVLMRGIPAAIAAIVHERHVAASVNLLTGIGISSIDPAAVHLVDGREMPYDTVVAGIGAAPETRLAETAGLAIANGIAVDATLRTSDSDIFAAGDCCSFPHPLFCGQRLRLEAWRNAQEQGALAAENMLGAGKEHKAVPWFWSDQYDASLQVAGLPDAGHLAVERKLATDSLVLFHLAANRTLVGVSGIGPGNSIARDIKLAEMLIGRRASPDAAALADCSIPLRSLLKT
jgi:3-phenylpropionate/trans-cinnamate dioxygenase ferredoxin reductase subunit